MELEDALFLLLLLVFLLLFFFILAFLFEVVAGALPAPYALAEWLTKRVPGGRYATVCVGIAAD